MIAALFVERGGVYYDPALAADVDPWGLVEARYPHLRRGEDGGRFAAALAAVRRWGGVLEHPAYSAAWSAFELPRPTPGAWTRTLTDPGWVCEVWQSAYGHRARKATWLYAVMASPPALDWTLKPGETWISWCANHGAAPKRAGCRTSAGFSRMGRQERNRTPPAFRDVLLDLARRSQIVRAA